MTATQLALDCEPAWTDPEPDDEDDDGPYCSTTDVRRTAEIHDLRGQGVGAAALWTAQTVPTGSYL